MEITSSQHITATAAESAVYDRESELKAFDDAKTGVKGLVDAGLVKIPRIFIHQQHRLNKHNCTDEKHKFSIPIIDLQGVDRDASLRCKVIDQVRYACEDWGFFQVINHGIPVTVLDRMLEGIRAFHEVDPDVKKQLYTRNDESKVFFHTNFDFYQAPASTWRDTLACVMAPRGPDPKEIPSLCRYMHALEPVLDLSY